MTATTVTAAVRFGTADPAAYFGPAKIDEGCC